MPVANYRTVIRRFYTEVMEKGNFDFIDSVSAPNFKDHDPTNPSGSAEGVKQFMALARSHFARGDTGGSTREGSGGQLAVGRARLPAAGAALFLLTRGCMF